MKPQHKRWRIFVDRPIQGALLRRAALYWAVCLMIQQLIVVLFVILTSTQETVHANGAKVLWHVQVSVLASLAVLPIILLDILKLSHRWVGPMIRFRAALRALTLGKPVPPLRFRDGDYWQDLARDLNVLTAEVNRFRSQQPEDYLGTEPIAASETEQATAASLGIAIPPPADFFHPLSAVR